jgi:hypothetical protein
MGLRKRMGLARVPEGLRVFHRTLGSGREWHLTRYTARPRADRAYGNLLVYTLAERSVSDTSD